MYILIIRYKPISNKKGWVFYIRPLDNNLFNDNQSQHSTLHHHYQSFEMESDIYMYIVLLCQMTVAENWDIVE